MRHISPAIHFFFILVLTITLPGQIVVAQPSVISQSIYLPVMVYNTRPIVRLAAGANHACALTPSSGVKCWGSNAHGQLGGGSTDAIGWIPVDVSGLTGGWVAVAAGLEHSCALSASGGMKCWGDNSSGQLGDGTTTTRLTPVDVVGLTSGVTAIAAGGNHTCAVIHGGVKCWGENNLGELGDGTTTQRLLPVDGVISEAFSVSAGVNNTCMLTTYGAVKCWGSNSHGQLGNGTNDNHPSAVNVTGLSAGILAISSGGEHNCALNSSDEVKCWGSNARGQLGDGTTIDRLTPVSVIDLVSDDPAFPDGARAVTTGENHTCALLFKGTMKCWGGNDTGQIGDTTMVDRLSPISNGTTADDIAAGSGYTCLMYRQIPSIYCWGDNHFGQLGLTSVVSNHVPGDVYHLTSGVTAINSGFYSGCSVMVSGGVKCWGGNYPVKNAPIPIDVAGLESNVAAVANGLDHACVLTTSGSVKCWGTNRYGQLGEGTIVDRSTPVDVVGLPSGVVAVATGQEFTCAIISTGGVKCWGENALGQLGNGTSSYDPNPTPADVIGLTTGIKAITAGFTHACALTNTGGVKCWGLNDYGQLGDGTTVYHPSPVDVTGLTSGVAVVSAGKNHTCAVTLTGKVKCWGSNYNGGLGDGTGLDTSTPVDVIGLPPGVTSVSAGSDFTCALTGSGGVMCWGGNDNGQLGDGTITAHLAPVGVNGLSSGVLAVSSGLQHACALITSGGVKCWGSNFDGALGFGPVSISIGTITMPLWDYP